MTTRRPGFTITELLIVVVLTGVTLAAVYQTLMVQEKSYRAGGAIIRDQDALRTAIGILESELREVSTIGSTIGGSDIRVAATDSVVFRAQRKIAFTCDLSRNDKWLIVATQGDLFVPGDSLLLFVDGDSLKYQDDLWRAASVETVQSTTNADCAARFPGYPVQQLRVGSSSLVGSLLVNDLTGVRKWAPVRSFEWVTYGIYNFGHLGWSLGRHGQGESAKYLVGGLAPRGEGLRFRYYNTAGSFATGVTDIARIRVNMTTDPTSQGATPSTMTTNLYLRNN